MIDEVRLDSKFGPRNINARNSTKMRGGLRIHYWIGLLQFTINATYVGRTKDRWKQQPKKKKSPNDGTW